jgi:hypothetical protein
MTVARTYDGYVGTVWIQGGKKVLRIQTLSD